MATFDLDNLLNRLLDHIQKEEQRRYEEYAEKNPGATRERYFGKYHTTVDDVEDSEFWGELVNELEVYAWRKNYMDKKIELSDLGTVRLAESFGGEGEGDNYYAVFKFTDLDGNDTYIKRHGWYASYDGGYYEGPTTLVTPVQKTITVYEEA